VPRRRKTLITICDHKPQGRQGETTSAISQDRISRTCSPQKTKEREISQANLKNAWCSTAACHSLLAMSYFILYLYTGAFSLGVYIIPTHTHMYTRFSSAEYVKNTCPNLHKLTPALYVNTVIVDMSISPQCRTVASGIVIVGVCNRSQMKTSKCTCVIFGVSIDLHHS